MKLLARRPLSAAELRQRLQRAGYAARDIEAAAGRLEQAGYLDDAELALHYILTRTERLGHGPQRLFRELERRGVAPALVQAVWERAVGDGNLDPQALLRGRIARRLGRESGRLGQRGYARMYNALLRDGFPKEMIEAELSRHEATETSSDPPADGTYDDLP